MISALVAANEILPEKKYISGYDVAPSLNYVKRWAPENWYLALLAPVHIISHSDFEIIEHGIESSLKGNSSNLSSKKKTKRNRKKR